MKTLQREILRPKGLITRRSTMARLRQPERRKHRASITSPKLFLVATTAAGRPMPVVPPISFSVAFIGGTLTNTDVSNLSSRINTFMTGHQCLLERKCGA